MTSRRSKVGYDYLEIDPHQETLTIARSLLGAELVTNVGASETAGIIVETEAYGPFNDPACHAHSGQRERNKVMFRSAGSIYVYQIYGMHYCVNIVTEKSGLGCAVLIRAIEPTIGIETMKKRRGSVRDLDLARGPGRLCAALGIDLGMNGAELGTSKLIELHQGKSVADTDVEITPRVGITKAAELPWRFLIRDSRFVSRKQPTGTTHVMSRA